MVWKKQDCLRPTQPYFVLNSQNFRQEVYLQQGISHFYSFQVEQSQQLNVVPDACIDLFFEYSENGMEAFACGTALRFQSMEWSGKRDVFGVRFMPGIQPALLQVPMRDLINCRIPLQQVAADEELLPLMAQQSDFYQRIRIILQQYTRCENKRRHTGHNTEKQELIWSVKRMVYESDGKVRISEISERTGYSERYINRVFLEEMGFAPKTFCKIIQFQRALEFLNYGAPDKMTDAAVNLGYYDQPQFIRDFKAYCGLTPLKYLRLIRDHEYGSRIRETNLLVDALKKQG